MKLSCLGFAFLLTAACDPAVVNPITTGSGGASTTSSTGMGGAGTGGSTGSSSDPVTSVGSGPDSLTILAQAPGACSVAVNDTDVYFITCVPNGVVGKVSKSGGPVTTIATNVAYKSTIQTSQGMSQGIALDEKYVYWIEPGGGSFAEPGYVKRALLDGSNVETITEDDDRPWSLSLTTHTVYWTDDKGVMSFQKVDGPGPVLRLVNDTTPLAPVHADELGNIAYGAQMRIALVDINGHQSAIPGDDSNIISIDEMAGTYFIMTGNDILRAVPGGMSVTIALGATYAGSSIVSTDGMVYLSSLFYGLVRMKPDGSEHKILAAGDYHAKGIALDTKNIYWATGNTINATLPGDGAIMTVPR